MRKREAIPPVFSRVVLDVRNITLSRIRHLTILGQNKRQISVFSSRADLQEYWYLLLQISFLNGCRLDELRYEENESSMRFSV